MTASLRHAVGGLLVAGLSGTELTGLERAWLKVVRPAGTILFRRNIADAAQTRALLAQASALCAPNSLRCVDVEGGTVDRLSAALAPMPSAQAVASAARNADKSALMHEHGELIARGVKAFGFNTTLAPVLDLALPVSASVMGTRAVSADPAEVVAFGRAFLAGLAAHGVVGCGKHFPGLGGGTLDSHLETPSIHRTLRELNQQDLVPYRDLRRELPMVMISHAAYPRTHGKDLPASVSRFWIETVLRKRIGYRGLVFSDDLEMGGVLKFMPIEQAAVQAIRAGSDLIEICHSPESILRAWEALLAEAERSSSFRHLVLKRSARCVRLRAKMFAAATPPALSARQFDSLRTRIQRFSQRVAAAQPLQETPSR